MGGKVKIWNPVEIAEQAKNDYASQIFPSLLSIDPSLSLPQMTPLVMSVTLSLNPFSFLPALLFAIFSLCLENYPKMKVLGELTT